MSQGIVNLAHAVLHVEVAVSEIRPHGAPCGVALRRFLVGWGVVFTA